MMAYEKKRSDVSALQWDLETCEVRIAMRTKSPGARSSQGTMTVSSPIATEEGPEPSLLIVKALADAESRMSFVALTLLRDKLLAPLRTDWERSAELRQAAVATAITEGIVLTSKASVRLLLGPRAPGNERTSQ